MQRTTTTAADIAGDVEPNVLARQMFGQRFAFGTSVVGLGDDYRTALLNAGNVAVEVFKRERQLIGIKAFGATPELRPLQLLDDGLEALDLTVAAVGGAQTGNTNVIPGLPGFAQEVATFVASGRRGAGARGPRGTPGEKTISLLAISVSHLEEHWYVELELPLGLTDEARRPDTKKGMARWAADQAVDKIRDRFEWDAIGYGSVARWAPLLPFPTNFANSPKRTCAMSCSWSCWRISNSQ